MTTTTSVEMTFTAALLGFLNALGHDAGDVQLEIHARSPAGVGYEQYIPTVPRGGWRCLPPFAFTMLDSGWEVRIGAATRRARTSEFASLSTLFAVFSLELDFRPIPGRESARWRREADAVAEVMARLAGFAAPPGFILDGFKELVALWPLRDPILDLDRARIMQRRLSETLGATTQTVGLPVRFSASAGGFVIETPADDPMAFLPLPGSIVRQVGQLVPVVTFTAASPDRIYDIHKMEAALGLEGATQ